MENRDSYGLLGFFTRKPFSQGRKSLFLWPGTIETSLVSIQKVNLELQPPKECSLLYYVWGDKPEALSPSQIKCYSKC